MFAVILICGNFFLRIAGKFAKIRTRQNLLNLCITRSRGGGGEFSRKSEGDARRKIRIKLLPETNVVVAQA